MNEQHEDLQMRERLRAWRGLEPRADFENEVWRRVAAAADQPATNWYLWLQTWVAAPPAWARAVALLLAVLAGTGLALLHQPSAEVSPLLAQHTLAGSYLALLNGGTP